MILVPEHYSSTPTFDLLKAAGQGYVAIDHRFLHAIVDQPESSLPELLLYLDEDLSGNRVDIQDDLVAICRYLRAPETLPFLINLLRGPDEDRIDESVVPAVMQFGEAAVESLLGLYQEFGPHSEVPFLLAAAWVKDERIEKVLEEVKAADPGEGEFCFEVYNRTRASGAEREPYDIWADYPSVDGPRFEVLSEAERIEFLGSPSGEHRQRTVRFLGREAELVPDVISRLVELARTDPEAAVRGEAWRALSSQDLDIKSLREEMRARLEDPEITAREKAGIVVALAGEAEDALVRKWIIDSLEDPHTRTFALEAMWLSGDRTFAPYVSRCLDDPDEEVRGEAIIAVGHLGITTELRRVESYFDDPDLRLPALLAYTLAVPAEVTPGRVEGIFRKVVKLAGDLDDEEARLVRGALDRRLTLKGYQPRYSS